MKLKQLQMELMNQIRYLRKLINENQNPYREERLLRKHDMAVYMWEYVNQSALILRND